MELGAIINWISNNYELVITFGAIATAFGALYQPARDLLRTLPRLLGNAIKFSLQSISSVTRPAKKLIAILYEKMPQDVLKPFSIEYLNGLRKER